MEETQTQYPPSVQVTLQLNIGAEASLNTILLKTHHTTIRNKNIENKDRYILKEFPYDGQIQRQSTSYYFLHHN